MSDIVIRSLFAPATNRAGKITATAEKNAHVLNRLTDAALLGAALTGRGAIAKIARVHIARDAVTLDSLTTAESLRDDQWGDLLGLLVSQFGVGQFSRATMSGRVGCSRYLSSVRAAATAAFDRAETVKQQNTAMAKMDAIDTVAREVTRLTEISIAERDARIERERLTLEAPSEQPQD